MNLDDLIEALVDLRNRGVVGVTPVELSAYHYLDEEQAYVCVSARADKIDYVGSRVIIRDLGPR